MHIELSQFEIDENTFEVTINYSDIKFDKNDIGNTIGYSDGKLPPHFEEMIDQIITRFPKKCNINAGYRLLNLQHSTDRKDGLLIGNKFFQMDKIVTSQLKKANKAALFLCTIGNEMELWAKDLSQKGDSVLAYLVDIVASSAVESIADILHNRINQAASKLGLNVTNRYSPGYCNWSVAEQQKLFSLLPNNFCNISLSDSSLMKPIKSISGIIGIGTKVKFSQYICDRCGVNDCTHRVYLLSKANKANNIVL
ncbi:MAG: hypothetical protein KKF62_10990 [Bacteroidetes bacterium]|nr:hypothetical protein [Bacteroidota bacterium]MBU1114980.1 hypothetical protein [Bacteroidota bacterium]MBU1799248.1 hypothetical protein [Bacteroidota bacterium]